MFGLDVLRLQWCAASGERRSGEYGRLMRGGDRDRRDDLDELWRGDRGRLMPSGELGLQCVRDAGSRCRTGSGLDERRLWSLSSGE